jgi:hypothetical protein
MLIGLSTITLGALLIAGGVALLAFGWVCEVICRRNDTRR